MDKQFESHTCPRRLEAPGRWRGEDGVDLWQYGHGLGDAAGLACSYCGSLEPDRFMQLVAEGWWVDPTDKSYKAHLAEPLNAAQVELARQRWMATDFVARVRDAACTDHASNVDQAVEHEWQQMPTAHGHGPVVAKFYYQHLTTEQKDQFIELINTKQMKIGAPGYFYVLPFFCSPVESAE